MTPIDMDMLIGLAARVCKLEDEIRELKTTFRPKFGDEWVEHVNVLFTVPAVVWDYRI